MVSKCANPSCSAPFRYLHEGRIFAVRPQSQECGDISSAVIERYWLCNACAEKMTLVLHNGDVMLEQLPGTPKQPSHAVDAAGNQRLPAA